MTKLPVPVTPAEEFLAEIHRELQALRAKVDEVLDQAADDKPPEGEEVGTTDLLSIRGVGPALANQLVARYRIQKLPGS